MEIIFLVLLVVLLLQGIHEIFQRAEFLRNHPEPKGRYPEIVARYGRVPVKIIDTRRSVVDGRVMGWRAVNDNGDTVYISDLKHYRIVG